MSRHAVSLNFVVNSDKEEPSIADIRKQLDFILSISGQGNLAQDLMTIEVFDQFEDE
tara:strand:- start:1144 stop:1314 length:171 start_codon:yes stop_codon:yes gene_type:complete